MKKLLFVLIALLSVFVLTGCGEDENYYISALEPKNWRGTLELGYPSGINELPLGDNYDVDKRHGKLIRYHTYYVISYSSLVAKPAKEVLIEVDVIISVPMSDEIEYNYTYTMSKKTYDKIMSFTSGGIYIFVISETKLL